jgi:hypothetical protein
MAKSLLLAGFFLFVCGKIPDISSFSWNSFWKKAGESGDKRKKTYYHKE